MWKKIISRSLLTHPRLNVTEDKVRLDNDNEIDYLKYEEGYDGAITVIVKRDDGKILIEKEYSYPPNEVLFQLPGGGINKGEKPEVATNRELMEEVNLKAKKLEMIGWYYINNRRSDMKLYVFVASQLEEKCLKEDETEDIEITWKSEEEIRRMIKDGEVVHPHFLAAWSIYHGSK